MAQKNPLAVKIDFDPVSRDLQPRCFVRQDCLTATDLPIQLQSQPTRRRRDIDPFRIGKSGGRCLLAPGRGWHRRSCNRFIGRRCRWRHLDAGRTAWTGRRGTPSGFLGRQVVPAQKQADHKGNLPDVPEFHFPIRQDPLAGFPATESEESSSSSSPDWSGPSSTAGESAEGLYFGLRLFGASGVSMT